MPPCWCGMCVSHSSSVFTMGDPLRVRRAAFQAPVNVGVRQLHGRELCISRRPHITNPYCYTVNMRIGIPGGKRNVEQITQVVQPQQQQQPSTLDWMREHPFRTFSVAALTVPLLLRWIVKPRGVTAKAVNVQKGVVERRTSDERRTRAVPRKHETTEEAMDLLGNTARKYVIVGGKGGVGKTSMSAAVATQFADRGQTTLIVSTDPAHSLSDAFGQSVSGGDPVPVLDIDNLYAQEVNPENMKRTFKMMSEMNGGGGATALGLEDMGLDDLNSLFETLPPGFDEAVALVEIIKYIEGDPSYARFDRIVFDTAPTGHTLRLLSLPDFLNGFFGKIISMKSKFGNVMNQFKGMFGGGDASSDVDASMNDMEELKRSMAIVRDLFRDEIQTEFIVATIPNMMAISESRRLVEELRKERIPVRHLFVNQVQPSNDGCTFCAARHKEQAANLQYISQTFARLQISTVQSFDREIKGAAALRAMGAQLFPGGITSTQNTASANATNNASSNSDTLNGTGTSPRPSTDLPTPTARAELVE